jgi:hypothetical protein
MSVLGGREVISMPGQGLEQKRTDDWIRIACFTDFHHSSQMTTCGKKSKTFRKQLPCIVLRGGDLNWPINIQNKATLLKSL